MSETMCRIIYGIVVTDAPDMKEAYDQIAEYAGSRNAGLEWQSDVMYGDNPTRIVVGMNASASFENFEGVNMEILKERSDDAETKFKYEYNGLVSFLKSIHCDFDQLPKHIMFQFCG